MDLIVLDGRESTISKDMVDSLQERFTKTAVEKNGQRVYIIRNCENATAAAQNSMLKFLEEPGAGITAILITDNINRLLPTILSRCTQLPFVPMGEEWLVRCAQDAGFEEKEVLMNYIKELDERKYVVIVSSYYNRKNNPPIPVLIIKK